MSHLSGKLETFSLQQILVLLAEAGTTGELHVASSTITGRVFFESGVVAYGTTRAGAESLAELDGLLESYNGGSVDAARPAIKEQLTEVMYGLIELDSGTFDFLEGSHGSRSFDVGVTFTVSELMQMVDERKEHWREIRKLIPSNSAGLSFASELPFDQPQVTIDSDLWALVPALAGGASTSEIAEMLGVSEFQAAQRLTELVNRGLVSTEGESTSPEKTESHTAVSVRLAELKREHAASRPTETKERPSAPKVDPKVEPVAFSSEDLTSDERNELIRNIGKGIYPSED